MTKKHDKTRIIANIKVGEPDVDPEAPSHVRGIFQGNYPHRSERPKGIKEEGEDYAWADARRSTGIRPKEHDVIDPRMPRLSPS